MADLKELAEKRSFIVHLDPRILKVKPGLNARDFTDPENIAHVEWMADSVGHEGVKKPIEVFTDGDDVFIADGECRWRGTMLAIERGAEIKTVPCIPESRGTNDVDRRLNQVVSNSGKQLTPLEVGANIKYALGRGWTEEQVAKKIGRSVSHIRWALDLQAAPSEVHQHIKAGEVSATEAAKVVRSEGPEKAVEVIREAVQTARQQGKSKATAKQLRPLTAHRAPEATPIVSVTSGDVVVRPISPSSRDLNVAIKGAMHHAPKAVWREIANAILAATE